MKADLHIHSTVSDGSKTRTEIINYAKENKFTHIAFADHDCTTDFDKVKDLGSDKLTIIPAIEISAYDFESGKKVHILGYDYKVSQPLDDLCSETLRQRNENCLKQIDMLSKLDFKITSKDVMKYSQTCIYKQHVLKHLFETSQTDKMFGSVYKKIFKNGGPCDFDIKYVDACDAVRAVKKAGGYAVLAHCGQQENYSSVNKLIVAGLDGIELFHPSNDDVAMNTIIDFAKTYGLFLTGGSDFHGEYEREFHQIGDWLSPENPITKN